MEHNMGLYETPFCSIKSRRKIVEVRLNDEKRRKVRVGDRIKFTKTPGRDDTLTVEVMSLKQYSTFREMYENIPADDLDAVGDSIDEMVENTYQIYTRDEETKWGTVAINIKLLD